ncbi:MAG: peptidoglycan DD-metalloendopeptidase family protein, partial [Oscillospiraceae bacterium]|nr:peptidoglycan DD-metalloendopeptidase family protein [Oscillospiraceae bacterium]
DSNNNETYNVYGINLISRMENGFKYYYLYNGQGDVTTLITAAQLYVGAQSVIANYYYDAFGVVQEESGFFFDTSSNPFRYAGYYQDTSSGLYYLNARFYDPATSRMLSEDTYHGDRTDPLSLNLYSYCRNNPLIYIDISGHYPTQAEYNAYAEYYGISQTGAWKDTVDQVLINDNKGSVIGSTSSPSSWASAGYAGNGSVSNISNDSYYALVDQWGLSTDNSPYKDLVDTMLGVGGFDSFTNVSIYDGYAKADYSQGMGLHNITPVIPQSYAPSGPSMNGNFSISGKGGALDVTTNNQNRVIYLQLMLKALGYTDSNGKVLTTDGGFGPNTIAALNKFKDEYFIGTNTNLNYGAPDQVTIETMIEVLKNTFIMNQTIAHGLNNPMPDYLLFPTEYRDWMKGFPDPVYRPSIAHPTSNMFVGDLFHCTCGAHASIHQGVDLKPITRGVDGDPITSAIDGMARVAGDSTANTGAGKYIQVWSFDGSTITQYMHLSAIGIEDGQIVAAGDTIGAMGNTGGSTGTHLHFGVQIYNEQSGRYDYIDPLSFLPTLP